jgi:hypothetical protein
MPIATPAAQVQIHQRSAAGMLPRKISTTIRAITHPAVMTVVMSRSFPSSGGGGERRGEATAPRLRVPHPVRGG